MIRKISGLLFAFALIISSNVSAQDYVAGEPTVGRVFAGALVGYGDPGLTEADGQFTFGLNGGYLFSPNMSVGAYIQFLNGTTLGQNLSIMPVQAEFTFYTADTVGTGLFVGGRAGIVRTTIEGATDLTNTTDTDFGLTVFGGYQHKVAESISLGGEVSFLQVFGSPQYDILSILGRVQFWF